MSDKLVIYHGSPKVIEKSIFSVGKCGDQPCKSIGCDIEDIIE